jgi:hypothetical protein
MKKRILTSLIIALSVTGLFAQNRKADSTRIAKLFPPIDIKFWDKTPVVNGRLPTYEETTNGKSLFYYKNPTPDVKPYNITLPKLAYFNDTWEKKEELVVVIQIIQTAKDTTVGYRPLTGSNGAAPFRYFRFLTDNEVKTVVGQ